MLAVSSIIEGHYFPLFLHHQGYARENPKVLTVTTGYMMECFDTIIQVFKYFF